MRIVFGLIVIIIGFVALFAFPIGTIIGVFLLYGGIQVLRKK